MAFSVAQYEAVMAKLDNGITELTAHLQDVGPAATAAANRWFIPPQVAEEIVWLANKVIELGSWLRDKIIELLKGAAAPVMMFHYAREWQDIRGLASGITADLQPSELAVDDNWAGKAAKAYTEKIKPQADAADRIGTVADKTATALMISAGAALTFYVALGVILVKLIAATIAAVVAFGTAVFSWAGAAIIVEEASVNTGLIITAVAALTAALAAQAQQMVTLHGETVDSKTFPDGHWPDPAPGQYSDATVTDGDADWSIPR
jgi:uncharacterized protein YukE